MKDLFVNTADRKFYVCDAEAGNIIDEFETMEDAVAAIQDYITEDKEEGIFRPDFYEIKHGEMLYYEDGKAKKPHTIEVEMYTAGSYNTGSYLLYIADGLPYEVSGDIVRDGEHACHIHIFPDGTEMEIY